MTSSASDPSLALDALASQLRSEDTVISNRVSDPSEAPALGVLAASGPATTGDPAAYALVIESVREGYLLHYGEPRVVRDADDDLRLLAGDYLYALGLERLAGLGDMAAVRELSDLISLGAQLHADGTADGASAAGEALWLASVLAIATGDEEGSSAAKSAIRTENADAAALATQAATAMADRAGLSKALAAASHAIQSPRVRPT